MRGSGESAPGSDASGPGDGTMTAPADVSETVPNEPAVLDSTGNEEEADVEVRRIIVTQNDALVPTGSVVVNDLRTACQIATSSGIETI